MAYTRFVRAAVLGDTITIYGTGEQIGDFTIVTDVVAVNLATAHAPVSAIAAGTLLHACGGSNVSVDSTRVLATRS